MALLSAVEMKIDSPDLLGRAIDLHPFWSTEVLGEGVTALLCYYPIPQTIENRYSDSAHKAIEIGPVWKSLKANTFNLQL